MRAYQITLRVVSCLIVVVALIHITLGVGGEWLLGAQLSAASVLDPNLDSQNRFYGAAFVLFAAMFWYASGDVRRHQRVIEISLGVFFLAGLARIVSILVIGWPTVEILVLTGIELLGPPLMFFWLTRLVGSTS